MDSPDGQARSHLADEELQDDEVADDQNDWLGVSVNYSPYHPGYTTNHWLMVFRAVEATA
jgi:hypothetical protein